MGSARSDRAHAGGVALVEIDLTGTGSRVVLPEQFVSWVEAAGLTEEFRDYWDVHPWRKTNGAILADFAVMAAAPKVVFDAVSEFIRTHDLPHMRSVGSDRPG